MSRRRARGTASSRVPGAVSAARPDGSALYAPTRLPRAASLLAHVVGGEGVIHGAAGRRRGARLREPRGRGGGAPPGLRGAWRGSTAVLRDGARRELPVNDGSGTRTAAPEAGAGRQQPAGLRHTALQPAAFSCPGIRGTRERASVGRVETPRAEGMKPLDGAETWISGGITAWFILKITPAGVQAPRGTTAPGKAGVRLPFTATVCPMYRAMIAVCFGLDFVVHKGKKEEQIQSPKT